MTFGSLFAGIGGIDLGLERAGMECRWQVEIDPFCRKVLAKHWPEVKRYGDITKLDGSELEWVDLICGGFPCQDLSQAGKRAGIEGARSGLWFEFARLVGELRPRYVLIENVPGLLVYDAMRRVVGELARSGYVGSWLCLRASDFGASHLRKRVFMVAHRSGPGRSEDAGSASGDEAADGRARRDALQPDGNNEPSGEGPDVAHGDRRERGLDGPSHNPDRRDASGDDPDGCDPHVAHGNDERHREPGQPNKSASGSRGHAERCGPPVADAGSGFRGPTERIIRAEILDERGRNTTASVTGAGDPLVAYRQGERTTTTTDERTQYQPDNGGRISGWSGTDRENLAHAAPGGRGELREPSGGDGLAHGSGEDLADSERARFDGREGTGIQRIGPPLPAARSEFRDGHVEDAGCAGDGRSAQPAGQRRSGTPVHDCGAGGALDDASDVLSDSFRPGLEIGDGPGKPAEAASSEFESIHLPEFAPGPGDSRWPAILAECPDLAPALESPIRELANGISADLVRAMKDRTKKLKALGNSVVPQCAQWIGERILAFDAEVEER